MSTARDPQSSGSHLPNLQSSPQSSGSQSNIQYGDNNQCNNGIIGPSSDNFVANNNKDCHFNFTHVTKTTTGDENELDKLLYPDISRDALHDSLYAPTVCHPGTRKTVRNAIVEWVSDPAGSLLLWLHGPAGVGKSVIAKTMSIPSNQITVIATFFFSTSSDKSGATLFTTLAWQLAKNVRGAEQYITAALKRNRLLPKSQLEHQFDQLVVQPLRNCISPMTSGLVMIIDGVDECIDEDMQSKFLNILKGAGQKRTLPLRFLICSRPEPRIRAILETNDDYVIPKPQAASTATTRIRKRNVPRTNVNQSGIPIASPKPHSHSLRYLAWIRIQPYLPEAKARFDALRQWRLKRPTILPSDARRLCRPMQLGVDKGYSPPEIHDEPDKICRRQVISRIQIGLSEESKDDIRLYLTDKFKSHQCKNGSETIPLEEIEGLVKISCGQFLYAFIIVKLLDNSEFSPQEVFKMAQSSSLPSPDLDKLYIAILDQARTSMRREHGIDAETDLATLLDIFAILLVLWENVQLADIRESFPIIKCLLNLEKDKLKRILRKMHSILDIIPGKSIRVYHRSFFEFLQQKHRSGSHCIAYPVALRRFLFLLSRVVLRHPFQRYRSQFKSDDKKQAEYIRNMVLAYPRNFFRRSANPTKLATFHAFVHAFIVVLLWTSFFWLSIDFWDYLIVSLVPSVCVFFVRSFLIMVLFIMVGSWIPFLVCYLSYVNRSIIRYPLFHPFLHPFLVKTSEYLLSR